MIIAMYSGVAGMSAHQTKLNVIGNNIANVNTNGFKSSRMTFSDVFYQNLQNASAPTANSGGVNSNQLGYGSKVGSIDVVNTIAGGADTGRALDVYINGEGYLPVKGNDGTVKYTRVGNLKFDTQGNLTDANGNMVLGIPIDATGIAQLSEDGTTNAQNLTAINVPPADLEKYTGIAIGINGEITGIKEGDPVFTGAAGTGWFKSVEIDPGSFYNGSVTMTKNPTLKFTAATVPIAGITVADAALPQTANLKGPLTLTKTIDATTSAITYTLSGTDTSEAVVGPITGTLGSGTVTFKVPNTATPSEMVDFTVSVDATLAPGASTIGTVEISPQTYTVSVYNEGGVLQKIDITQAQVDDWDEGENFTIGDMTFTIADKTKFLPTSEGTTIGKVGPGNGTPVTLAYLAVAKFANADGLNQDGDGYTLQSANSGEATIAMAGTKGTGNLRTSALEMSNVDLAREFTDMIIAQRGFQANTRMITVSDSILEELINLKR
ncbi:flagellar hook-basal body complex protein [Acetobacterium bakii]|uniref:Flagellar hook protein FlgE n=1 Tax=Acetobacterium bakii TaxID=52689 RepID=A0A0L6U278_9FIRM|nr:flagellar hook-basal body complex protein [Acetobacterium bakii]KNZ42629.1 hypothetical protein AKG39_05655 [Acetobacterium bakii]